MKEVKKKKRMILCCLLFLFLLSGCSLASEESDEGLFRDRLIGGLVTREPIEKTYAEFEAPMEDGYLWGMEFDGIRGFWFFYHEEEWENGEVILSGHQGGSANLNEVQIDNREEKERQEIELKAKCYVAPKQGEEVLTLYLNPMYQTVDNQIYVLPGSGGSVYVESDTNEMGVKQELAVSEEDKFTLGKTRNIDKVIVSAEIFVKYTPIKNRVIQFDKENQVLAVKEYLPKDVPRNIVTLPETEYVMIETELLKPDGKTVKQRELFSWEGDIRTTTDKNEKVTEERKETYIFLYQEEENGFLKKEIYFIVWTQKE